MRRTTRRGSSGKRDREHRQLTRIRWALVLIARRHSPPSGMGWVTASSNQQQPTTYSYNIQTCNCNCQLQNCKLRLHNAQHWQTCLRVVSLIESWNRDARSKSSCQFGAHYVARWMMNCCSRVDMQIIRRTFFSYFCPVAVVYFALMSL